MCKNLGKEKKNISILTLGVVSQVGSEVHNLKVGDNVWFNVPYCVQGSLANFLVLDRDFVRRLPASVSFEGGATLPYSGMVAWDMLVTCGGLGPSSESRGGYLIYIHDYILLGWPFN